MRLATALLSCCLTLTSAARLVADEPLTLSHYSCENGPQHLDFKMRGEDAWDEIADGQVRHRYREVGRTSDYVELLDAGRGLRVRLGIGPATWSRNGKDWNKLTWGTDDLPAAAAGTAVPPMLLPAGDEPPTGNPSKAGPRTADPGPATDDPTARAVEALNRKDFATAVEQFTRALRAEPTDGNLIMGRGIAHMESGDAKAAVADFNRAIELGVKTPDIYFARAEARLQLGQPGPAVSDYRIAIKLAAAGRRDRETLADFYNALAWTMAVTTDDKVRDGKQAWEAAKKAIELHPDDPRIMSTVAAAYAEGQDFEQAVQWAKKALAGLAQTDEKALATVRKQLDLYRSGKLYRE